MSYIDEESQNLHAVFEEYIAQALITESDSTRQSDNEEYCDFCVSDKHKVPNVESSVQILFPFEHSSSHAGSPPN